MFFATECDVATNMNLPRKIHSNRGHSTLEVVIFIYPQTWETNNRPKYYYKVSWN